MVKRTTRVSDKTYDARHTEATIYSAAVSGAIMPLQRVATDKQAIWGDTLPSLVPPAMAARFKQVYAELELAMDGGDAVKVHEIATRLITAWGVLEKAALDAGHSPIARQDGFVIALEGRRVTCICHPLANIAEIKRRNPTWVVYSADNAARIIAQDFAGRFLEDALDTFPNATVTRITRGEIEETINDEIPF